jgi:transcriptional regulator
MHPKRTFHWDDHAAIRNLVREVAFGALFTGTPDGPRVVHLPAVWLEDATLGLHLARGNGIARWADDATALFVVQGPDGYVSPDWYGEGPARVPTWNYVTVELEGVLRRLDRAGLRAQIVQLGNEQESRLPKPPWTLDKVDPRSVEAMLDAIVGYRLEITAWRGTLKLGQNKSEAARHGAAEGLAASGRTAIAQWMRAVS